MIGGKNLEDGSKQAEIKYSANEFLYNFFMYLFIGRFCE